MDFKAFLKNSSRRISDFLDSVSWRKVLTFIGFLVIAFIFWLMLFFQRTEESTYRLPLNYIHVPNDIVFDEKLPDFLEVRILDKGSQLFNYQFLHANDSLEIDVGSFQQSKNKNIQGNQLMQLIRSKLSPSTEVRGYYPPFINLSASKLQKKELPVVFDGEISAAGTHLVSDSTSFIPETVMAYGSKERLDKLTQALTEYTVFDKLKATSQLNVKIKSEEGVKFVPNEVEIYIPIQEYTERMFEIPITATHVPANIDVKFFPSRANVYFSVTLEEYKKFYIEDFAIQLNYDELKTIPEGKTDIVVTKQPKTIRNVRVEPQSVEFLFEKN